MKKKLMVLFCAIMLLSSSIVGCGEKESTLVDVTLNEVAHSIFYAPMYVAIENGYFEEEGINLTLVTGFGADKTMTALLTQEADIGFMGPESTVYTYIEGMDDYAVNFAQLTQRAGNFLVARKPVENFEWSDLKGTYVLGGRQGGMPEMVFEYILKKHNLVKGEDLEIDQSIDFGSTAAAFSSGTGDYTVEFEPHATALEEKGDGYVIASLGEESGYVPYTAFSARKSYIEENPDIIQSFVNALQKGMDYVKENTPEDIAKTIAPQFSETQLETLTTIITRYYDQDTWKEDLIFKEEAFTLLQDILLDAKVIDKSVEYSELVNTTFAESAAK
ncbi:MAG: ABC transporter substrate-binding protein [Lachnospiraceae bacterium]